MEGNPNPGAARIGRFDFTVESTPDSDDRRMRRVEALSAWLLAEWRREREPKAPEPAEAAN